MKQMRAGCQLYSLRKDAQKDLMQTLSALHAMGYEGVEFTGFYAYSAAEISAMMKACSLEIISSFVDIKDLILRPEETIAFHRELGCRRISVLCVDEDFHPGKPGFAKLMHACISFGMRCRENDMHLLYHNHCFEFDMISGMHGLDFMMESIPADLLQMEPDCCWIQASGIDPAAYIRKYAGRISVIHMKDCLPNTTEKNIPPENSWPNIIFRPLGMGCVDLPSVAHAAADIGVEWLVWEQDQSHDYPPLEAARISREYLYALGV